jgi:hypothetical protein
MASTDVEGTCPFGSKLVSVVQADRSPKPIFVLDVYANAVHARWVATDGRVLVQALAVASEPAIFWNGSGADAIVRGSGCPRPLVGLKPLLRTSKGRQGAAWMSTSWVRSARRGRTRGFATLFRTRA